MGAQSSFCLIISMYCFPSQIDLIDLKPYHPDLVTNAMVNATLGVPSSSSA
jgi:hypothetical protein